MNRDRWILAACAVVGATTLVLLAVAGRADRTHMPDANGSTYSAGPAGARALFEYLERRGVPVDRLEQRDLPAAPGDLLFIVDPAGLSSGDASALLDRVEHGLNVVIATASVGPLMDAFEIAPVAGRTGKVAPAFPSALSRGVSHLEARSTSRVAPGAGWVSIFGDDRGAMVTTRRFEQGRIVVCTDPFPFTNAGLGRRGNRRFVENLVTRMRADGGRVLFDEHHHGFSRATTPLRYLADAGLAVALYLALLLAALWIWSRNRLGPPVPLARPERRTAAELVDSLATLLAAGGRPQYPLRALYKDFRRRIADRVGIAPSAPAERLFKSLAPRDPQTATLVYKAAARAEELLATESFDDRALLDSARLIAEARGRLEEKDATKP